MKTKVIVLLAFMIGWAGMAQKSELKAAEKALDNGDAMAAKSTLESISGMIDGADDKYKAQYYFIRGNVYADLGAKGTATAFPEAVASYEKVLEMEANGTKTKYSADVRAKMEGMTADLVNSAVDDSNNGNHKEAAEKLYMGYKMSPKDTVYLYYAASSAVNAKEYEAALKYYNELKDLNYDGSSMEYKATNVETGEVENFQGNKIQRDLMVKAKSHSDPVDDKTESKKAEIVKNIALIYTTLGDNDKALEAYAEARQSLPNDVNLVLNEANLYYTMGDKDKFKELMGEAAEMAPDNPDLHYNIGVINMEQGNLEEARAAYRRTLEIDPTYVNAQLNLSTTYVNEGNGLIDEMNTLTTSRADTQRYDELKAKKDELFKEGAKILEDALERNPDNQSILSQLKNIYGAMGDNENFMRIKKLMGES